MTPHTFGSVVQVYYGFHCIGYMYVLLLVSKSHLMSLVIELDFEM